MLFRLLLLFPFVCFFYLMSFSWAPVDRELLDEGPSLIVKKGKSLRYLLDKGEKTWELQAEHSELFSRESGLVERLSHWVVSFELQGESWHFEGEEAWIDHATSSFSSSYAYVLTASKGTKRGLVKDLIIRMKDSQLSWEARSLDWQ